MFFIVRIKLLQSKVVEYGKFYERSSVRQLLNNKNIPNENSNSEWFFIYIYVPYQTSTWLPSARRREPGCLHRPFSRLFCCHPTLLQKKNLLRVPERLRNIRSVCTSATVAFTTTCTGIRRSSHPAMSRHSTEPPPYFVASSRPWRIMGNDIIKHIVTSPTTSQLCRVWPSSKWRRATLTWRRKTQGLTT